MTKLCVSLYPYSFWLQPAECQ